MQLRGGGEGAVCGRRQWCPAGGLLLKCPQLSPLASLQRPGPRHAGLQGGRLGGSSRGTISWDVEGQFAFHHPQEMQLHNQPRFGLQAGTGTLLGGHSSCRAGIPTLPKLYHPPASAMLTWMFFRPILRSRWARFSDSSTCRHAQAAGGAAAVLWLEPTQLPASERGCTHCWAAPQAAEAPS